MAVDSLQGKIRKTKNPTVLNLGGGCNDLPLGLLEGEPSTAAALGAFCRELMGALEGLVPALRFSFGDFALLGPEGLTELQRLLRLSAEKGYYTVLDAPEVLSAEGAGRTADALLGQGAAFPCDAAVLSCYLGTDVLRPFLPYCRERKKDVFVLVRSANRSAGELQDLLTGSRLAHTVAADYVNRYGEETAGKYGYTRVGVMAAASSAGSLRTLRSTYPRLFLLIDGADYPNASVKGCASGFDRMGYGAAICVGTDITGAWRQAGTDGADYAAQAVAAAERIKRNIGRYVTIL